MKRERNKKNGSEKTLTDKEGHAKKMLTKTKISLSIYWYAKKILTKTKIFLSI